MSTPTSHESYVARAQKIHAEVLKIYNKTAESLDKLKNESSADQLFLLREANAYANDLNKVVFNLSRAIFKIDRTKHIRHTLQHIINTLCDLISAIHRSFGYDHEEVKIEFKNNIKSAAHVAEQLLAVICSHDIQELKLDILNSQADVLFAVDRVCVSNLLKCLNQQQLEDIIHNQTDIIKTILLSLDSKDPNIKQKINQCTKHNLEKMQSAYDYIQKATTGNYFNDEIKNMLLDIAKAIHEYYIHMHNSFLRDSQFDQLIADCHKDIVLGVGTTFKLAYLFANKDNAEVSDRGMELMVYCHAYAAAGLFQLTRNLEYVKSGN